MSYNWPVHRFGELDSTNTEAKRRAVAGGFQDQWIVADLQTAGRGRQDRVWSSPAGNIFNTALFVEPGGIVVALRVPFAAALAVVDTVLKYAPDAPVKVKWPNDVRCDQKKISGILVETGGMGQDLWIAAGIGINVSSAPENVRQPATSVTKLCNHPVDLKEITANFQSAFERRLIQARAGFDGVRRDWLEHAEGLGEKVAVRIGEGTAEGTFEDLELDGALRLRLPDGEVRIIRAGEVNLIGRV